MICFEKLFREVSFVFSFKESIFSRFTPKIYTVYAVVSDIKGIHLYLITPKTWHELLLSLQILFVFNQLREKIYIYRLKCLHESKCTFIKQKMWITLKKIKGRDKISLQSKVNTSQWLKGYGFFSLFLINKSSGVYIKIEVHIFLPSLLDLYFWP